MKPFKIAAHLIFTVTLCAFGFSFFADPLAEGDRTKEYLPDDFSKKVFKHIVDLAHMGHRQAGTENEKRAARYIKDQFKSMDIEVEIQPFVFESFEYSNVTFKAGGIPMPIQALGFNPYKYKREFEGTALLVDGEASVDFPRFHGHTAVPFVPGEVEGRILIANDWSSHFNLLRYKPELIIFIDPLSFMEMTVRQADEVKIIIEGAYKSYISSNVIGRVGGGGSSSKEIVITAHYDTYRQNNPGASDNASGIGVLLELARYFKGIESELDCQIKFIAFGGEEIGIVGSRCYLFNNSESLQKCELLFNIDDVGGDGPLQVEMEGGVRGIPDREGSSQIPDYLKTFAWEGVDSDWRMLAGDELMKVFSASNHPQWLVDIIDSSVGELGYEVTPTGTQGSDQLTFAQAGFVTSGIGIIGDHSHTPQDVPEHIHSESLKAAGEITARIILKTAKRIRALEHH